MTTYTFFSQADASILSAERQEQLRRFAAFFVPKAKELGYKYDDVCSILYYMSSEDRALPLAQKAFLLFNHPGCGQDLMPLLLEEGIGLSTHLENFYGFDLDDWVEDAARGGLHSAHFRISLPKDSDRIANTIKLCSSDSISALDGRIESEVLSGLSAFTFSEEEDADWLEEECTALSGHSRLSVAKAFWMLDTESKWSLAAFGKVIKAMGLGFEDYDWGRNTPTLATRYGRFSAKVLPIIFNMGYRMMAAGQPAAKVIAKVDSMIDAGLKHMVGKGSHEPVKRQSLVNFSSAFPDCLALIQAKCSELYGLPAHIDAPTNADTDSLPQVFGGPLVCFGRTTDPQETKSLIASFLASHGYDFKLEYLADAATPYLISRIPEAFDTISHPSSRIQNHALDWLTGRGPSFTQAALSGNWLGRLLSEQSIAHYSDVELLAVIESAIRHNLTGNLSAVFVARPQIKGAAIEMLAAHERANIDFFSAFGFDREEMRALGTKASSALIDLQLSRDLGL